jgi:hypothetical protein
VHCVALPHAQCFQHKCGNTLAEPWERCEWANVHAVFSNVHCMRCGLQRRCGVALCGGMCSPQSFQHKCGNASAEPSKRCEWASVHAVFSNVHCVRCASRGDAELHFVVVCAVCNLFNTSVEMPVRNPHRGEYGPVFMGFSPLCTMAGATLDLTKGRQSLREVITGTLAGFQHICGKQAGKAAVIAATALD